jgi:hypothetical protein
MLQMYQFFISKHEHTQILSHKQQQFTAHKLNSCNKLIIHKCNIFPSVPNLHDIDGLTPSATTTDHVTHSVQLAQFVKATDSVSFNGAS